MAQCLNQLRHRMPPVACAVPPNSTSNGDGWMLSRVVGRRSDSERMCVCVGIRLEFAEHLDLKRTLINQYRLYWKFEILLDVSHVLLSRVPALISASSSVSFILFVALRSFGKLHCYYSGIFFLFMLLRLHCSFCNIFLNSNEMLQKVQYAERTGSVIIIMKSE